eukprot:gene32510-43433_t
MAPPCPFRPLLGRQHHEHLPAFHARIGFDLGGFGGVGLDALQQDRRAVDGAGAQHDLARADLADTLAFKMNADTGGLVVRHDQTIDQCPASNLQIGATTCRLEIGFIGGDAPAVPAVDRIAGDTLAVRAVDVVAPIVAAGQSGIAQPAVDRPPGVRRRAIDRQRAAAAVTRGIAEIEPVQPLRLHGEDLNLLRVLVDGQSVSFRHEDGQLVLDAPAAASFVLEIRNTIAPEKNTQLSGLYASGSGLFTQCEAEGFRRITYFLDRPDVMAVYTVTLRADKARFPVLLSNGNLVEEGELAGGKHFAKWHDPFPKPSYLFAVVAADLVAREQRVRTRSGQPQGIGIGRDLEEPLAQFPLFHQGAGTPGAPFPIHLFIGENGLVDGIPVHRGVALVGQAPIKKLQEDPLGPAVVIAVTGGDFP